MERNKYRVPKAVYYQCVWILKDMDRLRRLEAVSRVPLEGDEMVFFVDEDDMIGDESVVRQAQNKLCCIRKALQILPPEYRQLTLDCIVLGIPFADTAHTNTWRRWRRIFINELAKNLQLI